MPFAATQMDLEIDTLSEVRQGQTSYDITQTWNPIFLKKKMKLLQNKNRLTDNENKLGREG